MEIKGLEGNRVPCEGHTSPGAGCAVSKPGAPGGAGWGLLGGAGSGWGAGAAVVEG